MKSFDLNLHFIRWKLSKNFREKLSIFPCSSRSPTIFAQFSLVCTLAFINTQMIQKKKPILTKFQLFQQSSDGMEWKTSSVFFLLLCACVILVFVRQTICCEFDANTSQAHVYVCVCVYGTEITWVLWLNRKYSAALSQHPDFR